MKNKTFLPPYTFEEVLTLQSLPRQSVDWGLMQLGVPDTWTSTQGEGIIVLVCDTGCPASEKDGKINVHPDLVHCIDLENCKSFVPGSDIYDRQGHGTFCCGVIGAANNDFGVVGYAPKVRIVTYKVLSDSGSGNLSWIVDALQSAKQLKPSIVSMSLGSTGGSRALQKVVRELREMGIVVVCAAGNGGRDQGVLYPARYDETMAIAAYDRTGKIADFSAVGDKVDFAFPGVDIHGTFLRDGYVKMSGTSMACPAAAGIVALMLGKHRKQEQETGLNDCRTPDEVLDHLRKYSVDRGVEGKDSSWGWGIVDVRKLFEVEKTTKIDKFQPALLPKSLWDAARRLLRSIF